MLEQLQQEEQLLTFDYFDTLIGWQIGQWIVKEAIDHQLPIAVEITLMNKVIFSFSMPLATNFNQQWIRRKRNTVYYFEHSSLWVMHKVNNDMNVLKDRYGLSIGDYAAIGGGYPLRVKGMGCVGSICVSGLSHTEDHDIIINSLKQVIKTD
jgi:uncharacterized protein (UPF0303 family)